MELDRYQALLCAIETGSLSAAAETLRYTPSGVSRMVATLEEEVGFPLLLRERNGVRPTQDCEKMLPVIRELLHAGAACRQTAEQIRGLETGEVVVGTAYSAFYAPLAEIMARFHEAYPGIQVQLCDGYSTELLEKLYTHQLDFCIVSKREGNYAWMPIGEDPMTAWLPANHPMAGLTAFPVEAFSREPYIETYPNQDIDNTRVFAKCKVKPNRKFATTDSLATYSMVEAGLGISMNNGINGRLWSGNVRILPLDPPQTVELGVAMPADLTPAAKRFCEFLKKMLQYPYKKEQD